jgi:hypothetical protein
VPAKLPTLDGPAGSWQFPAGVAVDQARVVALEQALGGAVTVADDAPRSWSFSDGGAPAADGDAASVATRLWTAGGYNVGGLRVTVSADGTTVTGAPQLDGVDSPLPLVVTVGAGGHVVAASGHLVDPAAGPQHDRVGTVAALGTLAGAPAGDDRGEQQPQLRPDPKPVAPALSTNPTTEPTVVDRLLPAVTGVTPSLQAVPGGDGSLWLLPAYTFTFADGSTQQALAVPGAPSA